MYIDVTGAPRAWLYRLWDNEHTYMCMVAPEFDVPLFLRISPDGIHTLWEARKTIEDSAWLWVCEYSIKALADVVRPYGDIVRDRSWVLADLMCDYHYIRGQWQPRDFDLMVPIGKTRAEWLTGTGDIMKRENVSGFIRHWVEWKGQFSMETVPRGWGHPFRLQKRAADLHLRRASPWEEMKVRAHNFINRWGERKMWAPTKAERAFARHGTGAERPWINPPPLAPPPPPRKK